MFRVVDGLRLLTGTVACHSKSRVLSDRRVTDVHLDRFPWKTNTIRGGLDEQLILRGGTKGGFSFVVISIFLIAIVKNFGIDSCIVGLKNIEQFKK